MMGSGLCYFMLTHCRVSVSAGSGGSGGSGGRGSTGGQGQAGSNGITFTVPDIPEARKTDWLTLLLFNLFYIATPTVCANSQVVVHATSYLVWMPSPYLMNKTGLASISTYNVTDIYLSFPDVGTYSIATETMIYENVINIPLPRVLPRLDNINIVNNTVVFAFTNYMNDNALNFKFFDATMAPSIQFSIPVVTNDTILTFATVSKVTPIPPSYLRIQFTNDQCGPSNVMWIPFGTNAFPANTASSSMTPTTAGTDIITPLCEELSLNDDECQIVDKNVRIPESVYNKETLHIPSDVGLVLSSFKLKIEIAGRQRQLYSHRDRQRHFSSRVNECQLDRKCHYC